MFKLAMIQMRVEPGRRDLNLARAATLVADAGKAGAHVVVLPEAMTLGWTCTPEAGDSDPVPAGESCARLRSIAAAHRVYLCAGIVEIGESIYNAAVLISPEGEVLLHHRKLNELEIAQPVYSQGDRLGVVRTPLATFGIMICSDAFTPGQTIARTLGHQGADVILSPCSWAVPAGYDQAAEPYGRLWVDNYEPVARDYRLWIAGVSNVGWLNSGPWKGRQCIGSSLAVSPSGQKTWGPYGVDAESTIYVEVETGKRPARGDGWAAYWARNRD